ncbi:hypothetical protein SAMN05444149_103191 [Pseudosulfitobacter pseudonitzschiae]|nr:hypothetical protein SAMN05444149_103191 [Pseudosulfitobacter pseudonitzschiae]
MTAATLTRLNLVPSARGGDRETTYDIWTGEPEFPA